MKFFLWTAYGNLDCFYSGGTSALPFQGVCQGNGTGPAIWLATSMVLMDMVHAHGHPVSFHSPILHQPTKLLGLIYVDDCDLFAMDSDGKHVRTTIDQLQQNIRVWQGGLAVTGGALSQKKSSWCLLAMRPQGKSWSFHTTCSFPASLTIQDSHQQPQPILGSQHPALMAAQGKANSWELAL